MRGVVFDFKPHKYSRYVVDVAVVYGSGPPPEGYETKALTVSGSFPANVNRGGSETYLALK